ncbi:methyl-accepting chemotaxis protein [Paenibacillus massiliensis]|uniref:methyl-accepting chemotaxis protein n=1 Tax=Paenibacillus massiliensis TaxID=225917 RepID=UPI00041F2530|nr:methyl-accepting chemotaxis protein [Paenibacillus massiliensis]
MTTKDLSKKEGQSKVKYSIRMKLLTGFMLVVVLLAGVSVNSLIQINQMDDNSTQIDEKWMPLVALLGNMNGDVSDVDRLAVTMAIQTNADEIAQTEQTLNALLTRLDEESKQLATFLEGTDPEITKLYETYTTNFESYKSELPTFLKLAQNNQNEEALEIHERIYPAWYTANDSLVQLVELGATNSKEITTSSSELTSFAYQTILIATIIVSILAVGLAILISIIISRPIQLINKAAQMVANGDLTNEPIVLRNRDELGVLASSFNEMTSNLRLMIQSVTDTTTQITASSEELLASAEQNSRASQQITEQVEEMSLSASEQTNVAERSSQAMGEMSIGTDQIAQLAQSVSVAAVDAATQSTNGNEIITHAVDQMRTIRDSITSLNELVTGLGVRSAEIGSITEVINNIAGQTNLLALNATIEAARAGEHGRGFAVVANEVRKLAEEAATSSQKITSLVQLIQDDTHKAVQAVQSNSQEAESGIQVINEAGQAFGQISAAVNKVASEIEEVSASSEQMSASTDEVVRNVDQVAEIAKSSEENVHSISAATQQQLASMEEITALAGSLSSVAEELQMQVSKFKL